MVWGVGVWVGPCFDVFGPRVLLVAGTVCTVLGMMGLSFGDGEFWWWGWGVVKGQKC